MGHTVAVVFFLLVLYQGEALRCNFCISFSKGLCSPTSIQTCTGTNNGCAAVTLTGAGNRSFRQCMNRVVCQGYNWIPGASASCCSSNLCN